MLSLFEDVYNTGTNGYYRPSFASHTSVLSDNLRIYKKEFEIIERRNGYVLTTKTFTHP